MSKKKDNQVTSDRKKEMLYISELKNSIGKEVGFTLNGVISRHCLE